MRTSPKSELRMPPPQSQTRSAAAAPRGVLSPRALALPNPPRTANAVRQFCGNYSALFWHASDLCCARSAYPTSPSTDLFFDLVFAAEKNSEVDGLFSPERYRHCRRSRSSTQPFLRWSSRIRSSSVMVCGSSHDPCGPGTTHSDFAPSKCELQYGTTPSVLFGESPFPRSPMIES